MIGAGFLKTRFVAAVAVVGIGVALTAAAVVLPASSSSAASCSAGYVGLTYDDGPGTGTTALLSALKSAGVRATMFNEGRFVNSNPSLAVAQKNAGMWIGNHSWDHPDMTTLTTAQMQSEINGTQGTISGNVGVTPKLFRPPYGATNAAVKAVANSYGLTQVTWDVDSGDWNGATTAQIVAKAATLKGGQVILMHDGLATTRAAIPQIASGLVSRNLCAGQISPSTGKAVAP